jgi:nucleoside-diphosphate-sugar epimerase
MIVFTAGGALYDAYATQYPGRRSSIREMGAARLVAQLQDGDSLVHNAANIASTDKDTAIKDNFILTRDLVDELAGSGKAVPMVFISSMSFLNERREYKAEDEMTAYALSKYKAEQYCLASAIRVSCVRFSTLFYRDPVRDGLSKMIADAAGTGEIRLINGGKDRRDFIPLTIAVQYLYKISAVGLGIAADPRPIVNIASGESISFKEAASIIKEAIPDLRLSEQEMPPSKQFVLSEFGKKDISTLGIVPFSLKDHILQYTRELL